MIGSEEHGVFACRVFEGRDPGSTISLPAACTPQRRQRFPGRRIAEGKILARIIHDRFDP